MNGQKGSEELIILESQAEYVMQKGGYDSYEVIERMKGKDLEGTDYIPPFQLDAAPSSEWSWRVLLADYVEKDNTGLVHTAPGHGPDDYETGKRYGIEPFCTPPPGTDPMITRRERDTASSPSAPSPRTDATPMSSP